MTYCVALRLNEGLVFLSDSRTNAGVDQIGTFRKMVVFEQPGERMIVMMTSGNLAISQAVRQLVAEPSRADAPSIWTVPNMFDAARVVGDAIREVHKRDAKALDEDGIDFNVKIIIGGQIKGDRCRLFLIYSAGNFIEAYPENPYFQIGESKYGKPVLDRMITPDATLDEGAKCALVSMDSTLRSNISVGLPLDLLCYEKDSLRVTRFVMLDQENEYFQMIHNTWGRRLKQVFSELPDPIWEPSNRDERSSSAASIAESPVRAELPAARAKLGDPALPAPQTISQPDEHVGEPA